MMKEQFVYTVGIIDRTQKAVKLHNNLLLSRHIDLEAIWSIPHQRSRYFMIAFVVLSWSWPSSYLKKYCSIFILD